MLKVYSLFLIHIAKISKTLTVEMIDIRSILLYTLSVRLYATGNLKIFFTSFFFYFFPASVISSKSIVCLPNVVFTERSSVIEFSVIVIDSPPITLLLFFI